MSAPAQNINIPSTPANPSTPVRAINSPSTPANAISTPTARTTRKKVQSIHSPFRIDETTLPTTTRQRVADLMKRIDEKIRVPAAGSPRNKTSASWIKKEDELLQLLRIDNFKWVQMREVSTAKQ